MDQYCYRGKGEVWLPTANLKWIKKDSEKILMQLWTTPTRFSNGATKQEWREIEIEQC